MQHTHFLPTVKLHQLVDQPSLHIFPHVASHTTPPKCSFDLIRCLVEPHVPNIWDIVVFLDNLLLQDLGQHHQPLITLNMLQNPFRGYIEFLPLQLLFILAKHLSQLIISPLGFLERLHLLRRQLGTTRLDYHHYSCVSVSSSLSG